MIFLRKYNTLLVAGTTSIDVPMRKRSAVDFAVGADWTPATGDVTVLVDAAAAANITNLPTAVVTGNGAWWRFILTAAELSSKQTKVSVVDATSGKAVEDDGFIIETFGHASAMYPADMSASAIPSNLTQVLGTAVTEGASGRLAAALTAFLNVASPVFTAASVNQTGDSFARLGAPAGASAAADIAAIFARLGAPAGASAAADIAAIFARLGAPAGASTAADIAAIHAKTTNLPGSPAAVGSAMTLTSGERASIAAALLDLSDAIEVGTTPRQALRLMAASLLGVTTGMEGTTGVAKGVGVATTRVTATLDGNNRTAVTLTP